MAIIVQKYGGTSVADPERIRRCAARAAAAHQDGHQVVVVVSAMGHTTDELIALAHKVSQAPKPSELDLLLATGEQVSCALMTMAIRDLGVEAVGLSVLDLGIETDTSHCKAKIRSIDASAIRTALESDRVVVVPGFQGATSQRRITTLGRGGSDTTAVAIAAALGIREGNGLCEIYTDVDGVYTSDPRIVSDARKIGRIVYEEMVELASLGAGVLHTRAVLYGQRHDVPIHVRHSERDEDGTMVIKETPEMERVSVVGCALTPDLGRITVRHLPNRPGVQSKLFEHIAAADILVDDIIQVEDEQTADVSFTVNGPQLSDLKLAVASALEELGEGVMSVEVGLAKVSAVGVGMRTHTGVAATMFAALGDAGIRIANITTSEIKISCIVPREHGEEGLRVVHEAFGLSGALLARAGEKAEVRV